MSPIKISKTKLALATLTLAGAFFYYDRSSFRHSDPIPKSNLPKESEELYRPSADLDKPQTEWVNPITLKTITLPKGMFIYNKGPKVFGRSGFTFNPDLYFGELTLIQLAEQTEFQNLNEYIDHIYRTKKFVFNRRRVKFLENAKVKAAVFQLLADKYNTNLRQEIVAWQTGDYIWQYSTEALLNNKLAYKYDNQIRQSLIQTTYY